MGGVICREGTHEISEGLMSRILSPYFSSCRYLKSAEFESGDRMGIRGELEIPSSCYVESSGHFNAVEMVICFNQLSYVMFGEAMERGLLPRPNIRTIEDYEEIQLGNVLITKSEMQFKKIINPSSFSGSVYVNKSRKIRDSLFYSMETEFRDLGDGLAMGQFSLIVV